MPEFDCTGCWQSFDYDVDSAEKRFEKVKVYQPEGEPDAFVCSNCGALLEPFIDDI